MGADYFLSIKSLISSLVMSEVLNIWLCYTPTMIALDAVEISITCENLVVSMARDTDCFCPLTCLCLIASIILAFIFWTSHSKIQDTLYRALRTFIKRVDDAPIRFPTIALHALGFRAQI